MAKTGNVGLDLLSPLTDAGTGVLTAGVPIAVHLGAERLVLVGCDSDDSDDAGRHSHRRVAEELAARGVSLLDATADGGP